MKPGTCRRNRKLAVWEHPREPLDERQLWCSTDARNRPGCDPGCIAYALRLGARRPTGPAGSITMARCDTRWWTGYSITAADELARESAFVLQEAQRWHPPPAPRARCPRRTGQVAAREAQIPTGCFGCRTATILLRPTVVTGRRGDGSPLPVLSGLSSSTRPPRLPIAEDGVPCATGARLTRTAPCWHRPSVTAPSPGPTRSSCSVMVRSSNAAPTRVNGRPSLWDTIEEHAGWRSAAGDGTDDPWPLFPNDHPRQANRLCRCSRYRSRQWAPLLWCR